MAKLTLLDMRAQGAGGGGAPIDATFITQTPSGTLTNEQALSLLATGLVKNTTGTGVLSIATQGTDYILLPVADTQTIVKGSADATKLLRFEVDGFTAGATRVMTPPNQDATLAGLEVANVFTAAQTINGGTDTQQLIVRSSGNPQTANLMELRSTTAAIYASFNAVGDLRLGSGSSTGAAAIGQNAPDNTRFGLRIDKLFATGGSNAAIQGEWGSTNNNDTYGLDYTSRAHHTSGVMANLVGLRTAIRKSNTANVTLAAALLARAPVLASTGVIATNYGLKVEDQDGTNITTAYAIHTGNGLVVFNESGDTASVFRVEGDTDQFLLTTDPANDRLGVGTGTPSTKLHSLLSSAVTNAITNVARLTHNSTGTAAAGFGTGLIFGGESSTTNDQDMGRLTYEWVTATHATRAARGKLTAFYTSAERECIRWEADSVGSLVTIGGNLTIQDKTDTTKAISFNLSGITAGATRAMTPPNQDTTLAGQDYLNIFSVLQTFNASLTASDPVYTNSERFGNGASIGADRCVVIGRNASAINADSVAIGYNVSIGAVAAGGSVVIGASASSTDRNNVVIGRSASGTREVVVIGFQAQAATSTVAIGRVAASTGGGSTAIGSTSTASGNDSTALGQSATASATSTTALGQLATASVVEAIAVGKSATAAFAESIALGAFATTTKIRQLVIGSATAPINEFNFSGGSFNYQPDDIATDTVADVATFRQNKTSGAGVGFGLALRLQGESSTTENQDMARLSTLWQTATHASRVADVILSAYYSGGESEILRGRGGASPLFGVLGATPVARQAHIVDPSGGGTQDAEARTAINAILVALENFGFLATS